MIKLYFIIFSFIFSMLPHDRYYIPNNNLNILNEDSFLPSNSIVDIRLAEDRVIFGTSGGLGYMDLDNNDIFRTFDSPNLPYGSNPAVITKDNIIAVSGGQMVEAAGGIYPSGTGIGYSIDNGISWYYKNQPIDPIPNDGLYQTITWGNQEIKQLSVTTEINNITYDLAVVGDYIYSASWAGGLRRFKFQNIDLGQPGEDLNPWQIIPLPMDNQSVLVCGFINTDTYEINPNDPINGGSHNHKGFSVFSNNDSTIWVGTAKGINKGIINHENGCIDWEHFNAITHGFSGDWVIGFNYQLGNNRIWAITWSTDSSEKNAISYSDDGGFSWDTPDQLRDLNIKFYNIYSDEDRIYASSENGLYVSNNGEYWSKISDIESFDGQKILSEVVYSSISVLDETEKTLWIGTPDGLALTSNLGLDWDVIRFWNNNSDDIFYAYPNPFYINEINQFNGEGFVRLVFQNASENSILNIFNFSMEEVIELNDNNFINNGLYTNVGEFIWDGRNSYGHKVSNGVYFCRLNNNNNIYWSKLVVIN